MRLMPRSLAGRFVLLLLLTLVVAQGAAFILFSGERLKAVREAHRENVVLRAAGLVRLLEDTPAELHGRVVQAASSRVLRFWIAEESDIDPPAGDAPASALAGELAHALGIDPGRVRVAATTLPSRFFRDRDDGERQEHRRLHRERRGWGPERRWHLRWLALSIRLPDGRWLNAVTGPAPGAPRWGWRFLLSLLFSGVAVALVAVLVTRRLTRPMRQLSEAADRFGRGEAVDELPVEGPQEARRTVRAFNRMRARLDRYLSDRTAMLAAISHDLRTPITSLRLRAEFVEDVETRAKIIETLDEMQRMTEAALAFIREGVESEATRTVDIDALVDSVVADLADVGSDVSFTGGVKLPLPCRPAALRRALRNVIENAVAYGERARVRLVPQADELHIIIEDDGPGIPDADHDRVFDPFVRLDESRSREGGGVGLGLAIARSIVRGHGGDIDLENRAEGGLSATLRLPRDG
jgi:signal transduction histidine kinase